jgi:hypothetical protein
VGSRVCLKHDVVLVKVSSLRNDHLLGHRVVDPKWSLVPLDEREHIHRQYNCMRLSSFAGFTYWIRAGF